MRAVVCVLSILALASVAWAAPPETGPAVAAAEAFVKTIAAKDFEGFKAACAAKVRAEHDKNPKNCLITRWWEAAQKAQAEHGAKWAFKAVKTNMPKSKSITFTRTQDDGARDLDIGLVEQDGKWLVDSAGAL